ncbi:hypothetical protein [Kribbella sp. NPDC050470]|uniref:hypothetical protein n=1 Tax=unclassified Kribbella TaxID=2644121 RepID=UPI0037B84478
MIGPWAKGRYQQAPQLIGTLEPEYEKIAAALGWVDQGRELIAATEAKFEQARTAHPEFAGKTITLGARTSEGYGAYVSGTGRVTFVELLGFRNNPAVQAKATEDFSVPVSRENLGLLNADLTVMTPIGVPLFATALDSNRCTADICSS